MEIPARMIPVSSSRKRHWWRWILASAGVLIVLTVAAVAIFIKLQSAPPPLALPTARARVPTGQLDGTWQAAAGSVAGFRVKERAIGFSNDVVGRTNAVAGTLTVSGGRVTRATFRVDLSSIKIGGKTRPQFASSLGTQAYPSATLTLTQPLTLGSAFTSGSAITGTATGQLAMHGASHSVTLTVTGRRDGSALQAAGSVPVAFSDWGIKAPGGFGFLGSLANHGVAEFRLVLHRSDNTAHKLRRHAAPQAAELGPITGARRPK